uniref:Uncharacterized protein n=1 Tax=Salmo trutta TaxID=8032 RepID=A0A673ZVS2_SALTR
MSGDCLCCLFDYETLGIIVAKSKVVGAVFRLIQFLVIFYVFGYVCTVQKSYQETDSVISSIADLGARVWDLSDYIPAQVENVIFVWQTNMIVTPNQTQLSCPKLPNQSTICMSDSDCTDGSSDVRGNGKPPCLADESL